jgi:acetyl esterase/lipase
MRRRRLLGVLAALAVVAAGCDYPNIIPQGPAPLRYRDPIFTTVVTTSGITYGTAVNASNQTVTLKLDLYRPPATDHITKRAVIVWVHGGGFSGGDKTSGEMVDEATHFAKEGYVNASINYRLEPPSCFKSNGTQTCIVAIREAREDAQTAVRFLRTHATTYGIDPTRIAIGGTSAGAITALEVGYATAEQPASAVRAAVSLSGADLLSPVGAGDAPALLFHGTSDDVVPYQWAVNTVNAAHAAHLDAFLESWQGAGHVPYTQFRTQILTQTRNFLWSEMDLRNADH